MQALGKDPEALDWSKFDWMPDMPDIDLSKVGTNLKESVLDIFDRGGSLDVDTVAPSPGEFDSIEFGGKRIPLPKDLLEWRSKKPFKRDSVTGEVISSRIDYY